MEQFLLKIAIHPVTTTVLTLGLFFQWYKQSAKEQSVKNNLFSIRRAVDRITRNSDSSLVQAKAQDLIDSLDATLATLGMRKPFRDRFYDVSLVIKNKFKRIEKSGLECLPNEVDEVVPNLTIDQKRDKQPFKGVRKK